MRLLSLIAVILVVGACTADRCPPSTEEVDGRCVRQEDEASAKSEKGAAVGASAACEKEGAMRCVVGSEVSRERCVSGHWQDYDPCPAASVCQRSATKVGTCGPAVDRCAELDEPAYCEGAVLHFCEAGKEVSNATCASPELCEAGRSSGVCKACLEGEFRCRGARLERCTVRGTWDLDTICAEDTTCNASLGLCGSGPAQGSEQPGTGTAGGSAENMNPQAPGQAPGMDGDATDTAGGARMCQGRESQPCGKCGMQTRTCDTATGQWSQWSECMGEGECKAGEPGSCGNGGTKMCNSECKWETTCTGQQCSGELTRACGRCNSGRQARSCDSNSGRLGDWTSCQGETGCIPGTPQDCGTGASRTCTGACTPGPCTCDDSSLTLCNGVCLDTRTDSNNCGGCGRVCSGVGSSGSGRPLRCHYGRCTECATDSDCAAPTPKCDTQTATCVVCETNVDCPISGWTCNPNTHGCVAP